ncbi:cysteine desulfurase family protein [Rhizobium sp. EC-SD404]|uniref:cysteine desulfurase family protein n=1 Tax=Rhizobium sp. EC-SD404 TaxID=2038389 RepID=UPI0012594E8A|nr:cysteine desulfurase family protein [Rhizobium sp. EC-SD404]VVT22074.1 Cysteine desulfurase [Rhizobium sp. EC-SD404]
MPGERSYLDYNATAPLLDGVREEMIDAFSVVGNPSSVHAEGRKARQRIEDARSKVAKLVGADPANVIFTSGASEAASHVLTPDFRMGRSRLAVGRLYVCAIEHLCVLSGGRFPVEAVERLPVDRNGVLDLATLQAVLEAHDTSLGLPMVAVALANNETGVIQPIAEISALTRAAGGILVVDAAQAPGRLAIDIAAIGADFLMLSAHKMGGPKGIGALVSVGQQLMPVPLVAGGGQESGHRSGTENLSAIVGFGVAAHIAGDALTSEADRLRRLRDRLETALLKVAPDAEIVSAGADRLCNTTYVALPGMKAETMQIALDLEGLSVSAGSACSSGKVGRSHVLEGLGLDAEAGAIRISPGWQTTEAEVDRCIDAFSRLAARRRRVAA